MEVTEGCTATWMGALVTPSAVTVTFAFPARGLPRLAVPLQVMKLESQTPPQTSPLGAMVANAVFDELNVKVVLTGPPEELSAAALICAMSPATRESVPESHDGVHDNLTWATLLVGGLELLPQPANMAANKTQMLLFTTQDRMPPPRAGFPSGI